MLLLPMAADGDDQDKENALVHVAANCTSKKVLNTRKRKLKGKDFREAALAPAQGRPRSNRRKLVKVNLNFL
jgi:hypothetical protein